MQFLYMKDDVSYEEFLATVYEAENEGTESKVLNVKAKAMTVEQVIDGKERNKLKDEECNNRECEIKGKRRSFLSKEERIVWEVTTERNVRISQEREGTPKTRPKTSSVFLM